MYPFGFGLSYTSFSYDHLKLSKTTIHKNESLEAQVTVRNTGKVKSDEVVELYLTHEGDPVNQPIYALKGFKRIALSPGESKVIRFTLTLAILLSENSMKQANPYRLQKISECALLARYLQNEVKN